ncbi:unnamed protein product [Rotaria sordida]|uniref:Uncharacterized protein n=1 Tax=Rotaria sordida TaxID=392033 RepID=A0A814RIH8_9BILA|nr:unnamed protein product [Rotaria sordida]CAF1185370.1 unnamed protein product [Rotaria sordida]
MGRCRRGCWSALLLYAHPDPDPHTLKINYQENKNEDVGHFDIQNNHIILNPTGPKNCLYDAISAQTNISSNELRQRVANHMRHNADCYLKMMPAYEILV